MGYSLIFDHAGYWLSLFNEDQSALDEQTNMRRRVVTYKNVPRLMQLFRLAQRDSGYNRHGHDNANKKHFHWE